MGAGEPVTGATGDAGAVRLRFPNRPEHLEAVRDVAADAAALAGFDPEGVRYVARLTGRLAARLMDPALDPPEDGVLEVGLRRAGTALEVAVRDDGPPFDPVQGGRAEQFAHSLLASGSPDWIAFTNLGRGGREFRALLHRPGTPADEGATEEPAAPVEDAHSLVVRASEPFGMWIGRVPPAFSEVAPAEPAGRTEEPAEAACGSEIHIELLRPDVAASVSRCIFDAYRLTYFDEMMYRPAQLVELNASGEMVSAVAVTRDGTVAGHVALEFTPGERATADVAAAVTHRAWRGHGIAERLFAYLIDEAARRGMAGLWCDAVTVHPFTQRLAGDLGFVPCGFHLAFEPPSTRFFGINDRPAHRGSSVVMFRVVGGIAEAPLDVPAGHREFIAGIYRRLGAPERLDVPAPAAELPARTKLRTSAHPVLEVVRLTVDEPGDDLAKRLAAEVRHARDGGAKVVEARVNLQAAGASATCEELENLGFLVTGVVPGGADADWLLLQFHRGISVDYDGMVVDSDEARRLLEVVRARDRGAG